MYQISAVASEINILQHNGMETIKFIPSQAKFISAYKNTETKLMNCCANIYLNKQYLQNRLIPRYAQMKFPQSSRVSISTQRKVKLIRIKDEIRFLYKRSLSHSTSLLHGLDILYGLKMAQ
jgi:hypothetical protein